MPGGDFEFQGIGSEGVIVYEVGPTPDAVSLHKVLTVGDRYQSVQSSVEVLASIPEGFAVSIWTNPNPNISGRLLSYGRRNSRQCFEPRGRRLRRVVGLQLSLRR